MGWTVETVSAVDAEIEALPVKLRARLVRLLETVRSRGRRRGGHSSGLSCRRMLLFAPFLSQVVDRLHPHPVFCVTPADPFQRQR